VIPIAFWMSWRQREQGRHRLPGRRRLLIRLRGRKVRSKWRGSPQSSERRRAMDRSRLGRSSTQSNLIATDDSQVLRFIPEAVGSVVAQRPSEVGLAPRQRAPSGIFKKNFATFCPSFRDFRSNADQSCRMASRRCEQLLKRGAFDMNRATGIGVGTSLNLAVFFSKWPHRRFQVPGIIQAVGESDRPWPLSCLFLRLPQAETLSDRFGGLWPARVVGSESKRGGCQAARLASP
jgi:hypothetical protein